MSTLSSARFDVCLGWTCIVVAVASLVINLIVLPLILQGYSIENERIKVKMTKFNAFTDKAWSNFVAIRRAITNNNDSNIDVGVARQKRYFMNWRYNQLSKMIPTSQRCRAIQVTQISLSCNAGSAGQSGQSGIAGKPGRRGKPGQPGRDWDRAMEYCFQCPAGPPGPPSNVTGPRGYRGLKGHKGKSGMPGRNGPYGMIGDEGPIGLPGATGNPGPRGRPGRDGMGGMGQPGQKGAPGATGHTGIMGRPGKNNTLAGLPGKPGRRGNAGPNGRPGLSGMIGEMGTPGAQGKSPKYCPCPANLSGFILDGLTPTVKRPVEQRKSFPPRALDSTLPSGQEFPRLRDMFVKQSDKTPSLPAGQEIKRHPKIADEPKFVKPILRSPYTLSRSRYYEADSGKRAPNVIPVNYSLLSRRTHSGPLKHPSFSRSMWWNQYNQYPGVKHQISTLAQDAARRWARG